MKNKAKLINDLWWFIENVDDDTEDRTTRFFDLREKVRESDTENETSFRDMLTVLQNMSFNDFCFACYGRDRRALTEQANTYLLDKFKWFQENPMSILDLDCTNTRRLEAYCQIRAEYNNRNISLEEYQNRAKALV